MSRLPIRILRFLLPLVVLGGAGLGAYVMYLNRPAVETQAPPFEPPSVRVQPVEFETINLTVSSQGTVQPRTSSQLVPEITGPITEVAESFVVGGFFEAGDVLLKIDPYDYQQAVITARSQLAQAELRLAQEEAEAAVARSEWEALGRGDPSALTLRQPQVQDARAAVAAAEAALDRGTRDLERAEIKAPYAGRVQSKEVDIGQFVSKGDRLAAIYAVDSAEIRLPLPDEELAYLDVPMSYRGARRQTGPEVMLSAEFAGQRHTWQGRIVRTESEIDPVSRMVHVVAEVRDPYAPGSNPSRPPLASGMFVEAVIEGRAVSDIVVLPWAALRGRDQVLVVDESSRLRYRQVEVLRSTTDEVLVRGGLAEGERVSVSALDAVTEGMAVRVLDDGTRLARGTAMTDAAPTRPAPALSAPSPVPSPAVPDPVLETEGQPGASEPEAAVFDIDPTLSREEQIAALRRQIESLNPQRSASAASPSPRPVVPSRPADAGAAVAPGRGAAGAREPAGTDARAGRGASGGRRGGRGGAAARRRDAGATAGGAAPSVTPRTAPNIAPAPAAPLARAAGRPDAVPHRGVAVLPFANITRNPADDRLAGEMAATMVDGLGPLGGVPVVRLDEPDETVALESAAERSAAWLISGGYQHVGGQLRITARLLDVATGELVETVKVDGTLDQLPTLLTEVVSTLRSALDARSANVIQDRALMPVTAENRERA
jgi:RND family efflux transporter MFP subunit